jgi:hypothetical protein
VSLSSDLHSTIIWRLESGKALAVASFLERLFKRRDALGLLSLAAAFLTPDRSGYVVHSEFIEYRLAGCALVSSAHSFLLPLSEISSFPGPVNSPADVKNALEASIGVVCFPLSGLEKVIPGLELELEQRLTLSWLFPERLQEKRVCIVLGRVSTTVTKSRWEAAAAIGIKVVVLSSGSWWDDGEPWDRLREGFISTDLTPDAELWQRIVDAVKSYPYQIDGIFTPTDEYLVSVAKAAETLGLFTAGPKPFSISTNKYLTSKLLDPHSTEYFAVQSIQDLESRLELGSPIRFPVISKPSFGEGSVGVFRADNAVELKEAVGRTLAAQKSLYGALVEPYVDGPEVDANLVLHNGRLLYSEVVDDFPSPAELTGDSAGALFTETQAVVPSKLPKNEQETIVAAMLATVQLQGFHTGIFHCEARARNSSMEYALAPGASLPDLQPSTVSIADEKPSVFLHEVNARVPGIMSSASSLIARGIDFWALQILCAVKDWPRYQALASPLAHRNHVALTNVLVHVSAQLVKETFPGVPSDQLSRQMVDGDHDPMPELSRRHANITEYVLRHNAVVRSSEAYGGEKGEWIWAATVVICSPQNRQHALQIAESFTEVYEALVKERDRHVRHP